MIDKTSSKIWIALDVMGADHGPAALLEGAVLAQRAFPALCYHLFGEEQSVKPLLEQFNFLEGSIVFHAAASVVGMHMRPSQAIRQGRNSSMFKAIESVKNGESSAVVSGGNTGALMGLSTLSLKTLPGIDRPAIACLWPTLSGQSIVLDVGATIGGHSEHFLNMAYMGASMAQAVLGKQRPRIALLNIGIEEIKGNEVIKEASRLLKEIKTPFFEYVGFVEGTGIGKGDVDVIVTDGFTGNIALKTAEGTAKQIFEVFKSVYSQSMGAKLGYVFSRYAMRTLKERLDPSRANGGVFLGLERVVVKSHGAEQAYGVSRAIILAYRIVENDYLATMRKIIDTLIVNH